MCLYGFPTNDNLLLDLFDPDDQLVSSGNFRFAFKQGILQVFYLGNSGDVNVVGSAFEEDDVSIIHIGMWWPSSLSGGGWRIVAQSGNMTLESIMEISQVTGIFTMKPDTLIDPFEWHHCDTYLPDRYMVIIGSGYTGNKDLPIGIYFESRFDLYTLIDSLMVTADNRGNFTGQVQIKSSYPSGNYKVVPVTNLTYITSATKYGCFKVSGTTTIENNQTTPTPGSGESLWEACLNARLSRLHVGDHAKVTEDPPLPNRVRDKPDTKGTTIVGQIQPSEEIEILEGPACANGWVWWKVRSVETGLVGWTVEGARNDYWLVPLE